MPITGDVLSRFELPVSADKARELALAVGADDWREQTASNLAGRVVVPTFTTTSGFWQDRRAILTEQLGFQLGRMLHGGQSWEYTRLPRVGEILQGTTTLGGIEEKTGGRGGRMRLVTLVNRYTDADGAPVLDESSLLIDLERQVEAGDKRPAARAEKASALAWSTKRTITRADMVRYAGASGDFNPIHFDEVFARDQGLPSVFSMGLLQGGMLAFELGRHHDLERLSTLRIRFTDRVWPGEVVTLGGLPAEDRDDGSFSVRLEARVDGRVVLAGEAVLGAT